MKTIYRQTQRLSGGMVRLTYYTPGDMFLISVFKLFFYITILWPIELSFWLFKWFLVITIKLCALVLTLILFILTLPFKLIAKIFKH